MHVTGDRVVEHGLVDRRLGRRGRRPARPGTSSRTACSSATSSTARWPREFGLPRSNGCAYADSAGHTAIQRMPNVSLQPAADGPDLDGLIGGVEDGIYVVGDKSWSIDMQRFNFQFTGQRFHRIRDGRLVGQLKDVAYQATTTDFWGSMARGRRRVDLPARRRLQLRQGPARPGRGRVARLRRPRSSTQVNVLNSAQEAGR